MADRYPFARRRVLLRGVAVVLASIALCAGGGVAWALWVGGGVATGPAAPVSAWSLPATATTCATTDELLLDTGAVTWPETSTPFALDYTATINGVAAPITDDGTTRTVAINQTVLQQLFGSLLGGTLTVEVTATLPGTSWTASVATETLEAGVTLGPLGLTLECTS